MKLGNQSAAEPSSNLPAVEVVAVDFE